LVTLIRKNKRNFSLSRLPFSYFGSNCLYMGSRKRTLGMIRKSGTGFPKAIMRPLGEVSVSASMSARPATKHAASAARGPARNLHVAGSPSGPEESLAARAERVAAVAAKHAAAVDHDSRVPAEAIAAARAERLLGAAIPTEFGGEGASIGDIVEVC
jgi:hypothetical protein